RCAEAESHARRCEEKPRTGIRTQRRPRKGGSLYAIGNDGGRRRGPDAKNMKIAIYNRGLVFDGTTPTDQPLGGSESSIVYMARELARLGHDVTVYCKTPEGSVAAGYSHYYRFFADYTSMPWDVVISFRSFDPFLLGRVAPRMIYWTGDASDQDVLTNFEHPALQEHIDLVFCVSEWHRRSFIAKFHLPAEK